MTILENHAIASGLTRRPEPAPVMPGLRAAEEFLLGATHQRHRRHLMITVGEGVGVRRPWFIDHAQTHLNSLLALEEGWDGRRARPLEERAVATAVGLIGLVMADEIAPAQFFPLPDGGVQLEWHVDRNSVEIEVDADGDAYAVAADADGTVQTEGPVTPSAEDEVLIGVRRLLQEISPRAVRLR